MRSIIFLAFTTLLSLQISTAQGIKGTAVYKIEVIPQDHFDDLKETNPGQYKQFTAAAKKLENEIEQIKFVLSFNETESSYQSEEFLVTGSNTANTFGKVKGIFYNNQRSGERLQQVERSGKVFTIQRTQPAWEITSQEKQIGQFFAKKAITFVDSFSDQPDSDEKEKVVAWFTTSVPVQFGPEGFGGLPGLIIELEMAGGRYYLDFLNFDQDITIQRPKSENLITFQEYQEIIEQLSRRYKEFHNLN